MQHARLRSLPFDKREGQLTRTLVEEYVLDAADVYARSAALFDFARREDEGGIAEVTRDQILSALSNLAFWPAHYEGITATVDRRWPAPKEIKAETEQDGGADA